MEDNFTAPQVSPKQSLDPINLVIVGSVVLIVGLGGFLVYKLVPFPQFSLKNTTTPTQTSTIIKPATNASNIQTRVAKSPIAITRFYRSKVIKIDSGSITFESDLPQEITGLTESERRTILTIKFSKETTFLRPASFVPYYFKKVAPTQPTVLQQTDIKTNDIVDVLVSGDLRKQKVTELNVTTIYKFPNPNILSGTISDIRGNTLIINGTLGHLPNTNTFSVTVTSDTEVMNSFGPVLSNLSNLEKEMIVTLYSNSPIDSPSFTAAKIDFSKVAITAAPTPTANISPESSPSATQN